MKQEDTGRDRPLRRGFRQLPVVLALFLVVSCSSDSGRKLCGQGKCNAAEISLLQKELSGEKTSVKRRAVLKGLLWLLDFTQDERKFRFIFRNYIHMLYEVSAINPDPAVKSIVCRIIRNEASRAEPLMKSIFNDKNVEDIILLVCILDRIKAPSVKYQEYYDRHLSGYDGEKCRRLFYRSLERCDYDKLTDVFSEYSHFRFAYERGLIERFRLPPDYRQEFISKCANIPFIYGIDDSGGYHDQNYFATHAVFAMTGYGEYRLPDSAFSRRLRKYIVANFPAVRKEVDDFDLVGEFVQCMKIMGLGDRRDVRETEVDIVSKQRPDGSWENDPKRSQDPYDLFHPTWTSITALHYDVRMARRQPTGHPAVSGVKHRTK